MPAAFSAPYSGGTGTEADPYLISTSTDLLTLSATSADWGKNFLMTNDIDMSQVVNFNPIGNEITNFTGVFNGNRYVIRNLTIDLPTQNNVGLFGFTSNSQIKNLGIQNCMVKACSQVGSLVGICGANGATVKDCYSTGTVIATGSEVGGLIGHGGTVTGSFAAVAVTGDSSIGGLVGGGGTISSCYATGTVKAASNAAGGLLGGNGSVFASYAIGTISGTDDVGGLVGLEGTAQSSFWDKEISGQPGSGCGKGLTTTQMKTLAIFRNAEWSMYSDWVMTEGQYPRLAWEGTGASPIPPPDPIPFLGSGTQVDPYRIGTSEEFESLSWYSAILNKHIVLTTDLDCTGMSMYPISDLGAFTGSFNGEGHVLRNVSIIQDENVNVGIFGWVSDGCAFH